MSRRNGAAVGGLVFAALSVAALAIQPKPPNADASAATVRHYFAGHSGEIRAAAVLSSLAALAFVVLTATLRRRLDRGAGDAVLSGGSVVAAVAILGAVLQAGLCHAQPRLSDDGLLSYFAGARMVFYVAPALAVALVGLAAAAGVRGVLPGWLAAGSALLGVVALAGGIAAVLSDSNGAAAIGLVGFILTIVWAAATGGVLLRERV